MHGGLKRKNDEIISTALEAKKLMAHVYECELTECENLPENSPRRFEYMENISQHSQLISKISDVIDILKGLEFDDRDEFDMEDRAKYENLSAEDNFADAGCVSLRDVLSRPKFFEDKYVVIDDDLVVTADFPQKNKCEVKRAANKTNSRFYDDDRIQIAYNRVPDAQKQNASLDSANGLHISGYVRIFKLTLDPYIDADNITLKHG